MKLIKIETSYADEFDVYGWTILKDDQEWMLNIIEHYSLYSDKEIGFGTNEGVLVDSPDISVQDITEDEAAFLKKTFCPRKYSYSWGNVSFLSIVDCATDSRIAIFSKRDKKVWAVLDEDYPYEQEVETLLEALKENYTEEYKGFKLDRVLNGCNLETLKEILALENVSY